MLDLIVLAIILAIIAMQIRNMREIVSSRGLGGVLSVNFCNSLVLFLILALIFIVMLDGTDVDSSIIDRPGINLLAST